MIVLVMLIILMFSGLYIRDVWKKFNKYLKIGDSVKYKGDEQLVFKMDNGFCAIRNKRTKKELIVPFEALQPDLWYNYEPKETIE